MGAHKEMQREALDCIYKAEAALQAFASQEEPAALVMIALDYLEKLEQITEKIKREDRHGGISCESFGTGSAGGYMEEKKKEAKKVKIEKALEQYKEKLEREGAERVERMIEKTIGTTDETEQELRERFAEQVARDNAEKLAAYEAELMAE